MATSKQIFMNGLWQNNQAMVALLGLCPLLAVSNNTINGLGLAMATLVTLLVSNALVSLIRDYVPNAVRIPVYVTIIASAVTVIDLLMQAYLPGLHTSLGIFIPLIVTNCLILARADAFASKHNLKDASLDALGMGLGFGAVLVVMGMIREIIGQGTLFAQADSLLGEWAAHLTLTLISDYSGVLLAILPPGAFITLGLLIALKNQLDAKRKVKLQHISIQVKTAPAVHINTSSSV